MIINNNRTEGQGIQHVKVGYFGKLPGSAVLEVLVETPVGATVQARLSSGSLVA